MGGDGDPVEGALRWLVVAAVVLVVGGWLVSGLAEWMLTVGLLLPAGGGLIDLPAGLGAVDVPRVVIVVLGLGVLVLGARMAVRMVRAGAAGQNR